MTTTSKVYGDYAVFVESKALEGAASRSRAAGTRARRFAPGESTRRGRWLHCGPAHPGTARTQDVLSPPHSNPDSGRGLEPRRLPIATRRNEEYLIRRRPSPMPHARAFRARSRRITLGSSPRSKPPRGKGIGSPSARPPRARSVKRNIGLSPVFKSHQIEAASLL